MFGEIPRPQSGNILAIWENDDLTCIPKFARGSYLIQTIASPVGRGSLGVSVAGGWCNEFLNLNGFVQILGLWFPDPTPPQKKKTTINFENVHSQPPLHVPNRQASLFLRKSFLDVYGLYLKNYVKYWLLFCLEVLVCFLFNCNKIRFQFWK